MSPADREPPSGASRSRPPLNPAAVAAGWLREAMRGVLPGPSLPWRDVTTVPDIPVVQLPALEPDADASSLMAPGSIWAVEVPEARRPSPLTLAVLGVLAGIAAMALGAAAVIFAGASAETPTRATAATTPLAVAPSVSSAERRVLALLAKPSTERIAFRGVSGLVLAVGSGGRAAILVRGLERAPAARPYQAWIVAPGAAPIRAARFVGTERAVFLTRPLGSRASVVVSAERPLAGPPERNRIVAVRGSR